MCPYVQHSIALAAVALHSNPEGHDVDARTAEAVPAPVLAHAGVVVAKLDPAVLAASGIDRPAVLIDARMRKYAMSADIRPAAACAIGVGPGFVAGGNVHVAIETLPGQEAESSHKALT